MVVDACFIASQIDVWTQAYNGPTSRRKYVLNLLNVLHKNVTEEYKTDQFLHVIYWFLIYKSNLGHFFRNEGTPPLPLLFFQQLLWHRPVLLVRSTGTTTSRAHTGDHVGRTHTLPAAHVCACLRAERKGQSGCPPSGWPFPLETEHFKEGTNVGTQEEQGHLSDSAPLGFCPKGLGLRLASCPTINGKEIDIFWVAFLFCV